VQRLHPEQGFEQKDIEELAEHVTEFSYTALEAMGKGTRPTKAGRDRSSS
jgi:hypothetical protein